MTTPGYCQIHFGVYTEANRPEPAGGQFVRGQALAGVIATERLPAMGPRSLLPNLSALGWTGVESGLQIRLAHSADQFLKARLTRRGEFNNQSTL